MELTRRDAAAALAALGFTGGVALGVRTGSRRSSPDRGVDRHVRRTLVAIADVVYPAEVSGTATFVESFLSGRLERDDHADGLRRAVSELDELAEALFGDPASALEPDQVDRLLREVGADTAEEDPTGTVAERVRYYVVNELLLALYASPSGGELVGIENPQGHPGGIESYRRRSSR